MTQLDDHLESAREIIAGDGCCGLVRCENCPLDKPDDPCYALDTDDLVDFMVEFLEQHGQSVTRPHISVVYCPSPDVFALARDF